MRVLLSLILIQGLSASLHADPPTAVEKLYQAKCAKCHGQRGEGTAANYPEPLAGDRSLKDLTAFIASSMPPDAKQKCTPEEAAQLASYIVEKFYSKSGPSTPALPRVTLNHLTARRYRFAVADLMTSFRGGTGDWGTQRGLKGSYNTADPKGEGKHVFERTDPEINFNFGLEGPEKDKFNPRDFSIIWSGAIYAPVTGEYEIILRSPNSVKLFVDNRVTPLIDRWVRSGDDKEHRGTLHMLGGRAYPFLLTFSKSGQGVQKSADQKAKEPIQPAAVSLSWIPPGRTEEIIPRSCLCPNHFPESLFLHTPFPPDDRSTGFERGSSVSKEWDQATTAAALETADYVLHRLNDLSGGAEPGPEYEKKLREFSRQFAERAFRHPLDEDQKSLYIDRQFANQPDPELAVQKMAMLVLKSPRFLYPGIGLPDRDPYAVASRLSFTLWDSSPDAPLLAAAASGQLATREQIAAQAERMAKDSRFRFKLREFLLQWAKLDQVRDLNKAPDQFPGFDPAVARDLRTSLELFFDDIIASDSADFRKLILADSTFLNGRLAKIYNANLPPEAPFQPVSFEPDRRAGLLTHPYLMSAFADATTTSPIRRGVFLARGVLGRALLPPEDAFVPLPPSLHPTLNTRERVILQTKAANCQTCHALINPLGFTLENFDAIGRFRKEERSRPIDATGEYIPRNGNAVKLNGARELAAYLANSSEAHASFVDKLFHFAVQQPIRSFGPDNSAQLKKSFQDSNLNIRKLLVEIAVVSALGPPAPAAAANKP